MEDLIEYLTYIWKLKTPDSVLDLAWHMRNALIRSDCKSANELPEGSVSPQPQQVQISDHVFIKDIRGKHWDSPWWEFSSPCPRQWKLRGRPHGNIFPTASYASYTSCLPLQPRSTWTRTSLVSCDGNSVLTISKLLGTATRAVFRSSLRPSLTQDFSCKLRQQQCSYNK